jgi:protocatechuate 3,4-dioxygenase beta subunit
MSYREALMSTLHAVVISALAVVLTVALWLNLIHSPDSVELAIATGLPAATIAIDDPERLWQTALDQTENQFVQAPDHMASTNGIDSGSEGASSSNITPPDVSSDAHAGRLDGVVTDDEGRAVPGATVRLYSKSLNMRLKAGTGEYGEFSFPGIRDAMDYRLWVEAPGAFRDSTRTMLELPGDNPYLAIELQRLPTGSLRGRMTDTLGNGISYRSLQLESNGGQARALTVTGDAEGRFQVDGIPLGTYSLRSRAEPYLEFAGIAVSDSAEEFIDVILDEGDQLVEGRVVDFYGEPVVGARVRMAWSQEREQHRSRSQHVLATDDEGRFQFETLASGVRKMRVSAPGFRDSEVFLEGDTTWLEVQMLSTAE